MTWKQCINGSSYESYEGDDIHPTHPSSSLRGHHAETCSLCICQHAVVQDNRLNHNCTILMYTRNCKLIGSLSFLSTATLEEASSGHGILDCYSWKPLGFLSFLQSHLSLFLSVRAFSLDSLRPAALQKKKKRRKKNGNKPNLATSVL